MHPVLQVIRQKLNGKAHLATVAIVARGGGQRWVVVGGMSSLLRALGYEAEIVGGTSGGGLAMLFYADGGSPNRAMVLRCLTKKGFARNGQRLFIRKSQLLRGKPVMDLDGLFDEAFTKHYPLNWAGLGVAKRPIFLTATHRHGQSDVLRLDGTSAAFVRRAAHDTSRLPLLAHDPTDATVLWDGSLTNDAPVDAAFALGATHVLVLSPRGAQEEERSRTWLDQLLMERPLRQQAPDLASLWVNRHINALETLARYSEHPRVLHLALPKVRVQPQTTEEALLAEGVKQGWDFMAQQLQLTNPPPYPAGWLPTLREHKLIGP